MWVAAIEVDISSSLSVQVGPAPTVDPETLEGVSDLGGEVAEGRWCMRLLS